MTIYWAFQTLTTVGYGDFGCYNGWEIFITCLWIFVGVAFYSITVGSLTSFITQKGTHNEELANKMTALDEFAKQVQLNEEIH